MTNILIFMNKKAYETYVSNHFFEIYKPFHERLNANGDRFPITRNTTISLNNYQILYDFFFRAA